MCIHVQTGACSLFFSRIIKSFGPVVSVLNNPSFGHI